ncbi:hypothetical protein PQJ75_13405 [Rhodoplanes sp. TEM]|uniref:Uncharacterized protein n=1 Tax=Rhodoplanes tepidamans TaxID=200616 RepID=A0ABT5J9J1_RHOTP|nr:MULTISPECIES: hypothetical protein [Rhodoplanes]MDC7786313.1 hypothetical protein [Rhodoplanes tepidamans]MDC7984728.1 hypothetical protein [Rhodoplanes sp. TEM]MDQ0354056.1 hypothetical protein [Rhodoplanes tepidamans]
MTPDAAVSPLSHRLAGFALHALVSGLPMAASIVLLTRLLGWGSFSEGPVGPIVFSVLYVIFSAALEAWAGPRWPRLHPAGIGHICFDVSLPLAERLERLRLDPLAFRHILTQLAMVSLLALAVLTVR